MPRATALLLAACFVAGGCASGPGKRPDEDPRTAEPAYWLAQPATTTVVSDDFESLWRACRSAAVGHSYTVDRVDFRSGLMTTLPLVSKQFFEFWRNDVVTPHDLADSSLHSVRRTIRFEVRRLGDGRYEATPKVLLERYSFAERRVTSVARFAEVFTTEQVEGSRARDRLGGDLPETYWYAAGRDRAMEKALAESIRHDLRA